MKKICKLLVVFLSLIWFCKESAYAANQPFKLPVCEDSFVSNKIEKRCVPQNNAPFYSSVIAPQYEEDTQEGQLVEMVYLKFDLSDIAEQITSAKLYVCWKNYGGSSNVFVYPAQNDNWSESTLTFDNQPGYIEEYLSWKRYESYTGEYVVSERPFDVTEYIAAEQQGDKTASLVLVKASVSSYQGTSGLRIVPREEGIMGAYLELNFDPAMLSPNKIPELPPGHPRIFLRPNTIEDFKEKLTKQPLSGVYEALKGFGDLNADGANIVRKANIIFGNVLRYIAENDMESGRRAVDIACNSIINANAETFNVDDTEPRKAKAPFMLACALTYDWCYDILTEQEKDVFAANFKRLGSENGIYPNVGSVLTSHLGEEVFMISTLIPAIAVYDEAPELFKNCGKHFFEQYVQALNFANSAGWHHQGTQYIEQRFGYPMIVSTIFNKMGLDNIFNESQREMAYSVIYSRLPDGRIIDDGDSKYYDEKPNEYKTKFRKVYMSTLGSYDDPFVQDAFLTEYPNGIKNTNPDSIYVMESVLYLLLYNPELVRQPVSDLPLTRYFGNPIGAMVARTGWDIGADSGDVVAYMKVGAFKFNNHNHLDSGSFQIYYKGPLAIDSGKYTSYGSSHDINYYKRTIAHNAMLVYDRDEKFPKGAVNDGGQRWPNDGKEPSDMFDLITKGYKTGTILAHYFGPDKKVPDFSYLKGDITDSYTDKVQQHKRSFLFINLKDEGYPGAFVVFDRVISSNPEYKKTWLLHSIEEPQLNGKVTTITRSELGYGGKLINHTFLPTDDNLQITKVGGLGHEFDVNGENFPADGVQLPNTNGSGAWRVEVSPIENAQEDLFLNVMCLQENSNAILPITPQMLETTQMVGVKILDKIVLFSKDGEKITNSFHISLNEDSRQMQYAITDVAPGLWRVLPSGEIKAVSNEGEILIFDSNDCEQTLEYLGDNEISGFVLDVDEDNKSASAKVQLYGEGDSVIVLAAYKAGKLASVTTESGANGLVSASLSNLAPGTTLKAMLWKGLDLMIPLKHELHGEIK
ncbi:MAG: DNRLRE domain-containing protein [Firmicutes bacterium]|nr:DNRLRE domain-containing protein [Bacillota bacterium]